jgi:hypothetical protein
MEIIYESEIIDKTNNVLLNKPPCLSIGRAIKILFIIYYGHYPFPCPAVTVAEITFLFTVL